MSGIIGTLGGIRPPGSTISTAFRDNNAADEFGRIRPADGESFYDLYVLSDTIWGNQDGEQYDFTENHGDDDAAGTYAAPIRTLTEVERRLRNGNGNGKHARIFLCGYGGPDFDNPTEGRLYWAQYVRTSWGNGAHDSYRTNVSYIGPRGMLPQGAPVSYSAVADIANGGKRQGKIKLTFSQGISAATYHIRWQRAAGREVFAPFAVEENDVDGASITSICSATYFGLHREVGDTFKMVIPAACIGSRGLDSNFEGVHVVGDGPHRIGDRVASVAPTQDDNPWPTFERVAFAGRTVVSVQGDLMADTCNFRDGLVVGPGARMRGRGNVIESGLDYQGGAVYRTAASQYDCRLERSCRVLGSGATQDPINDRASLDWVVTGNGGSITIGSDVGGPPASLRIMRGLGVNCKQSGTVGIKVYGGSRLYLTNIARLCVTMDDAAEIGIWGVDGARLRLNDGPVDIGGGTISDPGIDSGPCVYGTDLDVKVGNETPLAFGTGAGGLREVAGVNGNQVSDYDGSRVWVPASEPTGYGSGGT